MKHINSLGNVISKKQLYQCLVVEARKFQPYSVMGAQQMNLDDGATLLLGILLIVGTSFAFAFYMIFSHQNRGRRHDDP